MGLIPSIYNLKHNYIYIYKGYERDMITNIDSGPIHIYWKHSTLG